MDYQQNQQIEIQEAQDESKYEVQVSKLLQILQESRRFTLAFIDELKEKALTPISQEILDHYHGEIKPNYTVKDIVNIIDKRISKMIRNKKIKKNWNFDDIVLLLWVVSKYKALHKDLNCEKYSNQDWEYISNLIPGSSPKGCMFKFISLKKVKLSSYNWSEKEENMLRDLVKKFGLYKWKEIAEYLYEDNPAQKIFRTPKQCRQHWNCYLDPKLKKGPWSEFEDLKLLQNVKENKGQRKWSSIKHLFEGRTQNALKNRYNLLMERQKKLAPHIKESQLIKAYLKGKGSSVKTIEPSQNSISAEAEQEVEHPQLPQQIYEEVIEESKQKIISGIEMPKYGNPEVLMKSQKSSFKLSQAYENRKIQMENYGKMDKNGPNEGFNSFMVVSMNGIPSIMTNSQGFYTNFFYKPYYS